MKLLTPEATMISLKYSKLPESERPAINHIHLSILKALDSMQTVAFLIIHQKSSPQEILDLHSQSFLAGGASGCLPFDPSTAGSSCGSPSSQSSTAFSSQLSTSSSSVLDLAVLSIMPDSCPSASSTSASS